jgi:hypothetical protein
MLYAVLLDQRTTDILHRLKTYYPLVLSNELCACRALDAVGMSWDNMHLKHILSSDTYCSHVPDSSLTVGSFNSQGQPLWHGECILYQCSNMGVCFYSMNSMYVSIARKGVFCKLQCHPCHYTCILNSQYLVMKGRCYTVDYLLETKF